MQMYKNICASMLTSEFDYILPTSLIAQRPIEPRDHSRLMVVNKAEKKFSHANFFDIVNFLQPGDVLVWNNSKVFKARLFGNLVSADEKELLEHKDKIEIFLVREMENPGVWKVLARPGRHVRIGTRVRFASDFYCDAMVKEPDGTILVQFPDNAETVIQKANTYGSVPLPPYIKDERHELETYQTIYAKDEQERSVAAPTAGFHFTEQIVEQLKQKHIEFAEVTLHVGLGTFLPVKTERVQDHTMHSEWVEITDETAKKINTAKKQGRRIVAVGTTSVRALEGVAALSHENGLLAPYAGDINMFITPGFEFKVVDALITNFHLPKSTLLMLVSAFAGDREFMLECYKEAVEQSYRFYSFGDAMFIY